MSLREPEFDDGMKEEPETAPDRSYLEEARRMARGEDLDDDDDDSEAAPRLSQSDLARRAEAIMEIQNLNRLPEKKLFNWNLVTGLVQVSQASLLFYLASRADTDWYLYTNYPHNLDERGETLNDQGEDLFGRPNPHQIASYNVTWYAATFISIQALYHINMVIFWNKYTYYLERHQNPFRWIDYGCSVPFMRLLVGQVAGITDVHALWLIFACSAIVPILGAVHENINAKARADGFPKQNWYCFNVAMFAHLAVWAILFNFACKMAGSSSILVWATVIIVFLMDATFAVHFYRQWGYPDEDYVEGEIGYIVLSATAKLFLAWFGFAAGTQ